MKLTLTLLAVWFVATFGTAFFARQLWAIKIPLLGFPLSFYLAAQGVLIIYVVIIWIYAKKMREFDVRYGVDEKESA